MLKKDIRTAVVVCGIIFWMVAGCATQQSSMEADADDPASELFSSAEGWYQSGALDQALTYFNQYLFLYPEGRNADAVLFRMGAIYHQLGDQGAAQAFLQRLLNEYPQSPWDSPARLLLIDLLIANQEEDQAISTAEEMLTQDLPLPTRQLLYEHLVRLHSNAGDFSSTVRYLFLQYESADSDQKERLLRQLTSLVDRLEADDIEMLWKTVNDHLVRSYLMFRYAMLQVMAENTDDALQLLTVFQSVYPDHPLHDEAGQFINTLGPKLAFQPNTLGCLLPLSGDYQAYGHRALKGIEMALSLQPAGESGPPVKIVVKDTGSSESQAVRGVRELAEAGVAAIIGPILTATVAASEAQRLGIPMVTFTQKPDIAHTGDWIFQHFITPENQVNTLLDYLLHDRGLFRFAVLYPQEPYGHTFMNLFWDAVIRKGGTITGLEAYDPKLTDFADPIRKLTGTYFPIPNDLRKPAVVFTPPKLYFFHRLHTAGPLEERVPDPLLRLGGLFPLGSSLERLSESETGGRSRSEQAAGMVDFDVLFIPDAPKTVGLILPQLAYYDVRDVIVAGTNLWHSEQLVEMTREFAQNALMVDGFFKDSQSGAVIGFVEGYRQIFGEDPGIIEAFVFDTANLIFSLLNRPDVQSRADLRSALHQSITAQGATGPMYFAQDGAAIKQLSLLRLQGGRFVEINRQ